METRNLRVKLNGFKYPTYVVMEDVPSEMDVNVIYELNKVRELVTEKTSFREATKTVTTLTRGQKAAKTRKLNKQKGKHYKGSIPAKTAPLSLIKEFYARTQYVNNKNDQLRIAQGMGFSIGTLNSLSTVKTVWNKRIRNEQTD